MWQHEGRKQVKLMLTMQHGEEVTPQERLQQPVQMLQELEKGTQAR